MVLFHKLQSTRATISPLPHVPISLPKKIKKESLNTCCEYATIIKKKKIWPFEFLQCTFTVYYAWLKHILIYY